jgi:predicted nuclease of predicted toxin-antitoxin system
MLSFLADMPVPLSTVRMAQDLGHDARHVREYEMEQAADSSILQRAARENRIILTMDLGFSRDVALIDIACPGLVIFRLGNVIAGEITATFRQLLTSFREDEIAGHILILEPGRVRRRALPIEANQ